MAPYYAQQFTRVMPEPPVVISSKDHLYLQDALSWELTAMKMMRHSAQECMDPEIRNYLDQAGQMHQIHYQVLLEHLNPKNAVNR
jgi:hypothetical protein